MKSLVLVRTIADDPDFLDRVRHPIQYAVDGKPGGALYREASFSRSYRRESDFLQVHFNG